MLVTGITPLVILLAFAVTAENYDGVKHCANYKKRYLPLQLGIGLNSLTYELSEEDIFSTKFTECQTTPDKKFLVPDGVRFKTSPSYPIKPKTKIDVQFFSTWSNYLLKPLTMETRQDGTPAVSRTFNADLRAMKLKFTEDKSIVRVQLRKPLYELYRGSVNHTDSFRELATEIGNHLANGHIETASYYGDLLIEKFGTNSIETMTIGGVLAVEYFVRNEYVREIGKSRLINIAKEEFIDRFNFTLKFGENNDVQSEDIDYFRKNVSDSVIVLGGNLTYVNGLKMGEKWEKSVDDFPVVIMREGSNSFNMYSSFSDYPPKLHIAVWFLLESVIKKYYLYNIHTGCTDVRANNFALGANLGDGSCNIHLEKYFSFGGVYQICAENNKTTNFCSEFLQKNILTNNFSCPPNFREVLLRLKTIQKTINDNETHKCVWHDYKHDCIPKVPTVNITYTTYWCSSNESTDKLNDTIGARFGGIYNTISVNPITGNKSCPDGYHVHKIDIDIHVCVGLENETYAAAFGGFYAYPSYNPYANQSDSNRYFRICPRGYSRNIANVDEDDHGLWYCSDINFYKTSFPRLVSPVSDISLRWKTTREETLLMLDRDLFFFRNSTSKPWTIRYGNTVDVIANIRRSPVLRKLFDTFLAEKYSWLVLSTDDENSSTIPSSTYNVINSTAANILSSTTASDNGRSTLSAPSWILFFAMIVIKISYFLNL